MDLSQAALIDFDCQNKDLASSVKHYLTFNVEKDLKEVMKNFYDKLREAENLPIKTILISFLDKEHKETYSNSDYYDTLQDKITRCS